jgi:DNA-directed RNA polymerase beta subunit
MTFMEDGTPIDIVLIPLVCLPYEYRTVSWKPTWAWHPAFSVSELKTPIFDGAKIEDIRSELNKAGISETGNKSFMMVKNGQSFKERVTVGIIYMKNSTTL